MAIQKQTKYVLVLVTYFVTVQPHCGSVSPSAGLHSAVLEETVDIVKHVIHPELLVTSSAAR